MYQHNILITSNHSPYPTIHVLIINKSTTPFTESTFKDYITANGTVNASGTVSAGTTGYSVRYISKSGSTYYIVACNPNSSDATTSPFTGMSLIDRIIEI